MACPSEHVTIVFAPAIGPMAAQSDAPASDRRHQTSTEVPSPSLAENPCHRPWRAPRTPWRGRRRSSTQKVRASFASLPPSSATMRREAPIGGPLKVALDIALTRVSLLSPRIRRLCSICSALAVKACLSWRLRETNGSDIRGALVPLRAGSTKNAHASEVDFVGCGLKGSRSP